MKLGTIQCHQFFSISYRGNCEYWTQKRAQSGHIHSIILDVHGVRQSAQNFPFNASQRNLDNNITLSLFFPCPKLVQYRF